MAEGDILDRFRSFIGAAQALKGGSAPPGREEPPRELRRDAAESFLAFIEQARRALEEARTQGTMPQPRDLGVPQATFERFADFAAKAKPLAVADARRTLAALAPLAPKVADWDTDPNVLAVAGIGLSEVAFTRLLAWALAPPGHPSVALACQNAFLSYLGLEPTPVLLHVAEQVWTDDGVPDLVLRGARHLVVVEAKTLTGEHAAPSGSPQTVAYAAQLLAGAEQAVRALVFLTLDGSEAENEQAVACTWLDVALCLVEGLSYVELPAGVRAAYAAVLSHWLRAATPRRLDFLSVLRRAPGLVDAGDDEVLEEVEALRGLSRLLRKKVPA